MTILLIIVLGGIAYIWFYYFSSKTGINGQTQAPDDRAELKAEVTQLRRIETLKLDTTIFEDKFFKSLEAPPPALFSGTEEGVPTRPNPFTPL